MTGASAVLVCVSVIFVSEVTGWTIDLPEVRRFYFEKFSNDDDKESKLNSDQISYDNINGDSLHNTDRTHQSVIDYFKHYEKNLHPISEHLKEREETKPNIYANGYNYDIYMVKKVSNGVIANGPSYLDGLRLAIERYIDVLKNCSGNSFSSGLPPNISLSAATNFSSDGTFLELCRKATEASEHVRRLADLALHATRRLQDVAYSAKYSKDASMEENELLLRLAWYLDKLAQLTGYEPAPEDYITEEPKRPPSPIPPSFNPLNVSDELKMRILNCIKEVSGQPATVRCAFPNAPSVSDQLRVLSGVAALQSPVPIPDTQRISRSGISDDTSVSALEPEILVATDNRGIAAPSLTGPKIKNIRKRSLSDENDPLVKQLKYYMKYKVWEFSNAKTEYDNVNQYQSFDVNNNLAIKHVQKRSLPTKYEISESPKPDLINFNKNKPGLLNIKQTLDLDKIFAKKLLPPKKVKNLKKLMRSKRYVDGHYGPILRPQIPTDPQTDISYYLKNKKGTNINPSSAQAALLRTSLEAVYQRGNINVVHRYGSNYNPAIPAPLYFGVLKTISDI